MLLDILRELDDQGLPEFVKTAAVAELDPDTLRDLDSQAFADPNGRRYPVHTKAAAYVSAYRYLQDSIFEGKSDPDITQRILQFAKVWGIEGDVKTATEKLAAQVEQYLAPIPDDKFLLVYTDNHGQPQRRFLAIDAETTKKAAVEFYRERHLYPLEQRRTLSAKFSEKIATFKPSMGGPDGQQASAYFDAMRISPGCPGCDASAAIDIRRSLINDYDTCKELEKTAKAVRSLEFLDPEATAKLAALLDNLDMTRGLYVMYGKRGLKLPEDDLYASFKIPVDNPHTRVKLASGAEFDRSDFEKVGSAPFEVLSDTLDSVYVDGHFNVDAAVKVAAELNRDDASLFGRAMASAMAGNVRGNRYRALDRTVEEDDVPLAGLRA